MHNFKWCTPTISEDGGDWSGIWPAIGLGIWGEDLFVLVNILN